MSSPFGISYSGIGRQTATFGSALTRGEDEGKVVKVSANKTVALCADGDLFHGVVAAIDKDDKAATVTYGGFVSVPYSGSAPSVGTDELAADAAGGVKVVSAGTGRLFTVVDVDTDNSMVTFLL